MVRILREADVRRVLTMSEALAAVEDAFRRRAERQAPNLPRRRVEVPGGALNIMAAGLPELGVMGAKCYSAFATAGGRHMFLLYSAVDGALLAIIEADWLGRIRTGATSGVATRYLARPAAETLAVVGTGGQALPQVEAICAVRPIRQVRVFGRDPERRKAFAASVESALGVAAIPADSARSAVDGAEIVTTVTTSTNPVVEGRWLAPGTHVNAAGSNWAHKRELDDDAVARAAMVVADAPDAARLEAGELIHAAGLGLLSWDAVRPLAEVVAAGAPPRDDQGITLFKSVGLALEDVAVAAVVYRRAVETGAGGTLALTPS